MRLYDIALLVLLSVAAAIGGSLAVDRFMTPTPCELSTEQLGMALRDNRLLNGPGYVLPFSTAEKFSLRILSRTATSPHNSTVYANMVLGFPGAEATGIIAIQCERVGDTWYVIQAHTIDVKLALTPEDIEAPKEENQPEPIPAPATPPTPIET